MADKIDGLKRTARCGEITNDFLDKKVTVMGWVQKIRNKGGVAFIDLRDRSGIVQAVIDVEMLKKEEETINKIRNEFVLSITGKVVKRYAVNEKLSNGDIEIQTINIKIISECDVLPFQIEDDSNVSESLKMKYRYLDIRRPNVQKNIIFKSKLMNITRNFFADEGFIEIETPILTNSTPEGARDYLVPSRVNNGNFYALPQSPQLFKQLLMLGGYDRYIQIARCFRDEDLRSDRQPEFTQIDMELSFVEIEDILEIQERYLNKIFKEMLNVDIKIPFNRMTYKEAIEKYGSDKPDVRFGMELQDLSDIFKTSEFKVFTDAIKNGGSVRAINVRGCGDYTRKQTDELVEFVKTYKAKGLATFAILNKEYKSSILKFLEKDQVDKIVSRMNMADGDLILIVADKNKIVFDSLGALRCEMARRLNLISHDDYKFLWVTEFPMFEYSEEEQRYVAMHHPFTAPMDEDIKYLEDNKDKVRAKAYDIVLNGTELGGGSIRIHQQDIQERVFAALGFSKEKAYEKFGFLLNAFKYGVPPHGGLAYGLDRLIMLMLGLDSIRETIVFPKDKNANCPMTNAPGMVDDKQLEELGIKIVENEKNKEIE